MIKPDAARRPGGEQVIPRPSAWRRGDAAPWTVAQPLSADAVAQAVVDAARDQNPSPPMFADARRSAVLVVLVDGRDGAEVLLTKRSRDLRSHAGEISFPGGRLDLGETAVQAALREANEEVGLAPDVVDVRGYLSRMSTVVSRNYIMPVIATLGSRPELTPHDREVERILWVPLVELADVATHREEWWGTPPLDRRMNFFDLDDETVWGATGHMLYEMLTIAYGPPAIRTAL